MSPGGVVVVGAINVDLVVAAPRLPAPGETVVGERVERHGGGKGANAAVAAARAGATVRLIGAVGADEHGRGALDELRSAGVDVDGVAVLDEEPTGVALIVVDPSGENQIAVGAGANYAVTAQQVRGALGSPHCVLVSTEIPGDAVVAAVRSASATGAACVLNPAPVVPAVAEVLDAAPIVTPNATEVVELAGEADVEAAARAVMARTGAPVIVTLGGDGALVLTPDGRADHIPPFAAEVRDTTGAGDTFNGVLAAHLAAGEDLHAAARAATAAAALSVGHVGARDGMPDARAIEAALR
jgi:ribokinase